MVTYGLHSSGFTPKPLEQIIQEKLALAQSQDYFGSDADISPSSPLRKFIEVISADEAIIWKVLEDIYYSAYLNTATGKSLDNVVSLLNLNRREKKRSKGIVRFLTGTEPIISGSSIDILSGSTIFTTEPEKYEFQTTEDKTLLPYIWDEISQIEIEEGNYFTSADNLVYACEFLFVSFLPNRQGDNLSTGVVIDKKIYLTGSNLNEGDQVYINYRPLSIESKAESRFGGKIYNIGAGLINQIQPFVNSNLLTVTNPDPFTGGEDRETDIELRERALQFTASFGRGTVDSIVAAVSGVSSVKSVSAIENYGDTTENGIPPHSLQLYVFGGSDADIQSTIDSYRPAGIQVNYSRPTTIPIYITGNVKYTKTANLATLESDIKTAILNYFDTLNPGDDVLFFEIANAISEVEGVFSIISDTLFISKTSPPIGTSDINILDETEVAITDTSKISLTLTPI